MPQRCIDTRIALLLAAVLAGTPPLVPAAPPVAPGDAVSLQVDPQLPPLEVPAEILEQLNGMARQSSEAMAKVNALLKENLATIQNAETIFDTMIETIRTAAAQGMPGGDFVKALEALAEQARKDAAAAKADGDQAQATYFSAVAAGFERSKGEAIAFYTSSFRNIRDIEREKRRFVSAMKRKHYELAKRNVAEGLSVLKALDAGISKVRDALPDQPVEGQ